MKKYLALLCATMLAVCCLALAACGGGNASSAASGSGSAASSSAAPEVSLVGDWKLAGLETQGVTMAGDMSAAFGSDVGMTLSFADGGKGTATFNGEAAEFTWEKTADGATVTIASGGEALEGVTGGSSTLNVTLEDGVLSLVMSDETMTGTMLFTQDGVLPGMVEISVAKATPITDEGMLTGDWKLAGMSMMGMNMYGDSASIAAVAGSSDTSISFSADGTCKMSGADATYKVSAEGAEITSSGLTMPVMALGENIILDMSGMGIDMVMMYSK